MTDVKQPEGEVANPFAPETYVQGGGLWDGKKVTITRAVAKTEAMTYGDGKPVMEKGKDGKPTGKQASQTGLFVSGIAEGEDKERTEVYGSGTKLVPTPDGESFVMVDGSPLRFHGGSGLGKFSNALTAAGYPTARLVVKPGQLRFSALVGSQLVFKAEAKIGKDGKPIKDAKGYDKQSFLPVKYAGDVAGVVAGGSAAAPAAGVAPSAIEEETVAAVLAVLAEGPKTRAELVRALAVSTKGNPNSNAIIQKVVNDAFHAGKPWKYDGTTASI